MKKIYFLTGNKTKLRRAIDLLKPEFEVKNYDLDIEEPQSDDQVYVAKRKTEQAFEIVKKPVFTQDCGYYIDKYNNFPGVFTKNVVFGLGKEGLARIIDENDTGYFQTTFAYSDGRNNFSITAKFNGRFSLKNLQSEYSIYRTFGNIFIPDTYNEPFALLGEDETDNILREHYGDLKKKLMEVVK